MYISPVKSLGLAPIDQAFLDKPGIAGDRAFFIIDAQGAMFTQRVFGPLVQVRTSYDVESGNLELSFPDGRTVAGVPELGAAIEASFFGVRDVGGRVVEGGWNEALSTFAGQALRLIKADAAGTSFDAFPISMCSVASLEALAKAAETDSIDGRRFRQNIYLEGASPHEEDTWLEREVRVGAALLRVKMRDPRCEIITHDPDTGETDMNTLKIIASYRTDQPKQVNFGVYCTVAEPGAVSIGDEVGLVT
ncbi:MAG: MOSC domain-containing protein [Planctomycetes bacterium]|nr:MOSC domain-containing protein [Planctomycetota bacterium]